jgi:hypothetical protein
MHAILRYTARSLWSILVFAKTPKESGLAARRSCS